MKKNHGSIIAIILFFVILDVLVWTHVFKNQIIEKSSVHFLNVGQGDATLVTLAGDVHILTDAGPGKKILKELEGVLPKRTSYLDLIIITHPEFDHYNGLYSVLDHYTVGAIALNGRNNDDSDLWNALLKKIYSKNIPIILLQEKDIIRYGTARLTILLPTEILIHSAQLNDTGIVSYLTTEEFRILLTADIGTNIERYVVDNYEIPVDILKVGHHGSKYSTGNELLKKIQPKIGVISIGKNNRYGHPTQEVLDRLSHEGVTVFRTDHNGRISIREKNGILQVFTERMHE